jgi:hypothetical protein
MMGAAQITAIYISTVALREFTLQRSESFVPILRRITDSGWLLIDKSDLSWAAALIQQVSKGKARDCLQILTNSRGVLDVQQGDPRIDKSESPEGFERLSEWARYRPATEGVVVENGQPYNKVGRLIVSAIGFRTLDVYDQYLFQAMNDRFGEKDLITPSRRESLRWLVRDLDPHADAILTLRLVQSRKMHSPVRNGIESRIFEYLPKLSKELGIQVRCEIKGERPVLRNDGLGSWFHGRFLVVDGRWVITVDRSLDWFADGHTVDNHLVRWGLTNFSASRLSDRWASLPAAQLLP